MDPGERRIGLALSDLSRTIARPFDVVAGERGFFAGLAELVEREQVTTLVIGLPLSLDGSTGPKALQVLKFRDRVEKFFAKQAGTDSPSAERFRNIQLEMWDERLTSAQAEVALRSGDLTARQRRSRIDKVAAQILLQSYLDCQAARASDAAESES